jgi:hypothetical protein
MYIQWTAGRLRQTQAFALAPSYKLIFLSPYLFVMQ